MYSLRSQKGFSLIELMVVVAIIAIISMIAIPNYKGFQAKARQKEGFNLMNTYYLAAHSTRAEFGVFPGDLVQTGFAPVGTLGYRLRSENGTLIPGIPNDDACLTTGNACNCGGACNLFKTWTEAPLGAVGVSLGPTTLNVPACGAVAAMGVTDNTFSIRVAGVISISAAVKDQYAMDENKQIAMCSDGLK